VVAGRGLVGVWAEVRCRWSSGRGAARCGLVGVWMEVRCRWSSGRGWVGVAGRWVRVVSIVTVANTVMAGTWGVLTGIGEVRLTG
jgi:hypothetical protein